MNIYIYTYYDPDNPNPVIIVREFREDLALEIAKSHLEELGCDDIELELQEQFDSRDRDIVYSTVEQDK